jgi:DNA-binding beta-propeller fold protein YncE
MTTPDIEPRPVENGSTSEELDSEEVLAESVDEEAEKDERKRRLLLLLLLLLLLCLCCVCGLTVRYLMKPEPLPDMLPVISQNLCYPPAYKLSFPLDKPVGVTASPDAQRIYGVESGGERRIKMFDRDGNMILSFAPPLTNKSNRMPSYAAVDATGRVFVTDTYNDVIAVFDRDGNFLDGIIGKDLTLSEFITQRTGSGPAAGSLFYFDNAYKNVLYQLASGEMQKIPLPLDTEATWSPLGLRFDPNGNLMVTNIVAGHHSVLVYPAADINGSLSAFNPQIKEFGTEGTEGGQFSFPNSVVTDSTGRFYVSDSNNARISVWTPDMQYKTFFGMGTGENALNLPRGLWINSKGCLHVVDNVGQYVRVYDVTGDEPVFQFNIGDYGVAEGEFNFPNDIFIDGTGRLYIADRENNRIQVWSY